MPGARIGTAGTVLRRDDDARELWHAVYADLLAARPACSAWRPRPLPRPRSSASGAIRRARLLPGCIRAEHLLAALAVWRYCEQSARVGVRRRLGDPLADTILSRSGSTSTG